MKPVDINAILAKYGCKKPRPEETQIAISKNLPIEGGDSIHSGPDLTADALESSPAKMAPPIQVQLSERIEDREADLKPRKTAIPSAYFAEFESGETEANGRPYDKPATLQAASIVLPSADSPQEPESQLQIAMPASDSIKDLEEQISEVRKDVNALHRALVNTRVHEEERLDKIEELLVMLLKRTE